jgi:hypothetical protein
MSRAIKLTLAFVILACALLPATFAQKKNTTSTVNREQERRSFAMNLVRAINVAEANYKKSHDGGYATWDTLQGNGDFTESGTKWAGESFPTVQHALYGRGPEIVPGWKLRLLISANGNAYDLLLEDVTDPKCGYAVMSDERGLIRQGKAIDCGGI